MGFSIFIIEWGINMLKIKGEESIDYFDIVCEKCNERTQNEYLGYDPSVPRFKATCKKCGASGIWKLNNWKGFPKDK